MTPIPSSPLVTVQSPAGPSQPHKRTRTSEDPLPTPKRPKVTAGSPSLKRLTPGKGKFASGTQGKGKLAAQFDDFPEDSCLFKDSQDSIVEPDEDSMEAEMSEEPSTPKTDERLSGNDLYLARRAKKRHNIQYFSIKYTIGLLYLGLLYTNQKVLPSDLNR